MGLEGGEGKARKFSQHPWITASVGRDGRTGVKKAMGSQRICLIQSFPARSALCYFQ